MAPGQRHRLLTSNPENDILDALPQHGNLIPEVLVSLVTWGRELLAVPAVSLFWAKLPDGSRLIAVGPGRGQKRVERR